MNKKFLSVLTPTPAIHQKWYLSPKILLQILKIRYCAASIEPSRATPCMGTAARNSFGGQKCLGLIRFSNR